MEDALDHEMPSMTIGGKRIPQINLVDIPHDEEATAILTWDPRREPRERAYERLSRQLLETLNRELDLIEAEAREQRAKPTPVSRIGTEHFLWLARYQVNRERYAEIARCLERRNPLKMRSRKRQS